MSIAKEIELNAGMLRHQHLNMLADKVIFASVELYRADVSGDLEEILEARRIWKMRLKDYLYKKREINEMEKSFFDNMLSELERET